MRERGEGWLSAEEVLAVLGAVRLPLVPSEFARVADDRSNTGFVTIDLLTLFM